MYFYSGGNDEGGPRKDILEFNQETKSWTVIAAMNEPRTGHAVTLISLDVYEKDYEKWCEMPSIRNFGDMNPPAKAGITKNKLKLAKKSENRSSRGN